MLLKVKIGKLPTLLRLKTFFKFVKLVIFRNFKIRKIRILDLRKYIYRNSLSSRLTR